MALSTTTYPINKTFNVPAPDGMEVEGFGDCHHPNVPKQNHQYVFRKEYLRDLLAFLTNADGDGLFISGPMGTGKTSLVNQIAARLHWPVQSITAHGRLEFDDLVGFPIMDKNAYSFLYGPLSIALREGHILVINEMDLARPSELSGLNDIIEGNPLVIARNGGEVIHPHPKFRLIATGNSLGCGDTTGLYQGVLQQNIAFLDRFRMIEVDYADHETEGNILSLIAPSLPKTIRDRMIAVANDIRKMFKGDIDDGQAGQLTVTMSTRTLERWAKLTLTFRGAPNAIEYALTQSLTARAEPEQRQAIHRIAEDIFGDLWHGDPTFAQSQPTVPKEAVVLSA